MSHLVAAEWIKLRSLRFGAVSGMAVLAAIALALLFSRYVAGLWDGLSATRRAHVTIAAPEQVLLLVTLISLGVVGVLMITSEYRSGTIRTSLAAVPTRFPVLAAKAVVVGGLGIVVGEGYMFVTYLASRAVIGDRPIPGLDLSLGRDAPLLLVSGLLAPTIALLGLALGSLLRSAAGGILAVVALLYVVPLVIVELPSPWNIRIGSLLPSSLPTELAGGGGNTNFGTLLPPWAAALVLAGYAVLPLAAAALVIRRRDVR